MPSSTEVAVEVFAKTIELRGVQFTIIGVAESGFTGHSVGYPHAADDAAGAASGMPGLEESAGTEADG